MSVFVRTRVVRNSAAALGVSIRSHVSRLCWLGERDSPLLAGRSAFPWLADPRVRLIRECGRPRTKASPSESRHQCFQVRQHVTLLEIISSRTDQCCFPVRWQPTHVPKHRGAVASEQWDVNERGFAHLEGRLEIRHRSCRAIHSRRARALRNRNTESVGNVCPESGSYMSPAPRLRKSRYGPAS